MKVFGFVVGNAGTYMPACKDSVCVGNPGWLLRCFPDMYVLRIHVTVCGSYRVSCFALLGLVYPSDLSRNHVLFEINFNLGKLLRHLNSSR